MLVFSAKWQLNTLGPWLEAFESRDEISSSDLADQRRVTANSFKFIFRLIYIKMQDSVLTNVIGNELSHQLRANQIVSLDTNSHHYY